MLLEVYIVLQLIALVAFILIFKTQSPLVSATSMVTSGILMVGAWFLETGYIYVWDPIVNAYAAQAIIVETAYLASFNILLFSLALIYFFNDIFDIYKNESKGLGNVKPLGEN